MKVRYVKPIGGTPVQRFLVGAINAEEEGGFVDPLRVMVPDWDKEGVFIIDKAGIVIAAMSFQRSEWNRAIGVGFSYVAPKHRRKGLHSKLFKAVCRIGERDGYLRVGRTVNGNNKPMIAAILKQGCLQKSVNYEFRLNPKNIKSLQDKFEL